METFDRKKHWENIYQTKALSDVSWFQQNPATSLEMIEASGISKDSKIIDIGGGDSLLVDHLLQKEYTDVTVLDISEAALDRAKTRLGKLAAKVKWIVADIATFEPNEKYDLWHDRAAFHFLTNQTEVKHYALAAANGIDQNGSLIIGTFSEQGPTKCSAIEIKQYSEQTLAKTFEGAFSLQNCKRIDHKTPFNTIQNFVFCHLKRC